MFDAAAGFGGLKQSGFGREGGWEGLLAYSKSKKLSQATIKGKPVRKQISRVDHIAVSYTHLTLPTNREV